MAKLKAPDNCTGASHNGKSYDVEDDGTVEVPDEAFADLLHHGFTVAPADEKPAPKKGK